MKTRASSLLPLNQYLVCPLLPTAAKHGELIGLKIRLNGRRYYPFRSAIINSVGGNMT